MYSFDVFDTIITRMTATPKGIFSLMQEELLHNSAYQELPDYIKENFYYLRINAEELARQDFGYLRTKEITLEQIYEALAMNGTLTAADRQQLLELEKQTEYRNTIGITENIDKMKELLSKGEKVVLISDMYLDGKTIHAMLCKVDPVFENIKLYVSSDRRKCKGGGDLYRLVKECEQEEYANWHHLGDNRFTDVKEAGMLGIQAEHYRYEAFTRYEKELIEKKEDGAYLQLTIGAARNARLLNHLSGAAEIGSSLGGVILYPYVWWLLQISIKKGLHRLYFIARDGYVLKKIADIIIRERQYDITTFYIYGSRRAWRMAAVNEENDILEQILLGSYLDKISSVSELAEVFQLTVEELMEFIPTLKRLLPKLEKSPVIREYIKKEIQFNKEEFLRYFSTKQEQRRNLVLQYLQQEIDYSDDDFAFVELAGSGITQGCMADIMKESYSKPLQTFFFKLDCAHIPSNCIFYDFLPSYLYLNIMIEMFARAPHGQTNGYTQEQDKIIPILNHHEDQAIIDHGFFDYLSGVEKFTESYVSAMQDNIVKADKLEMIIAYMKYITITPDQQIMEFIGGMPNNVTGREKKVVEYAPVLSGRELREIYLNRGNTEPVEKYYPGTAIEYSLLRSGKNAIQKREYYSKHYNKLLGKLARLPRKWKKDDDRNYQYEFCNEIIEDRIVLYGAGKVGKALRQELIRQKRCHIVQWVDTKYEQHQKEGLDIAAPEEIGTIPFDQILIAMMNEQQADVVKKALIQKGIPSSKIIWMKTRVR